MTTTDRLLQNVQQALDEFDDRPLDVSVRRVVRLASLLGESKLAVRLGLDLKPSGGHPPANAENTRRLIAAPSTWGEPNSAAEHAILKYTANRRREDGKLFALSSGVMWFLERDWDDMKQRLSDRQQ